MILLIIEFPILYCWLLNRKLYKGEAIRVFTGSKIPDNTKAVIIQENVQKINKYLIFHKNNKIEDGNFIRKKGFDFKKNKIIEVNKVFQQNIEKTS